MYERRHEPLLPRRDFLPPCAKSCRLVFGGSLVIGILGYHFLVGLGWTDSVLNASMILGGMGPVDEIPNEGGKIFASLYALYSGLIVLVVAGLSFAPIFHRFLHHFHLAIDETSEGEGQPAEAPEDRESRQAGG
jgi:hypothetical protein